MKYLHILIFFFSFQVIAKPDWLKKIELSYTPTFQTNYFKIDHRLFANSAAVKDELDLFTHKFKFYTQAFFKPATKYILINNLSFDTEVFHHGSPITNQDFLNPRYQIQNTLVGIIPLSQKTQFGHVLVGKYAKQQTFESRFEQSTQLAKLASIDNEFIEGTLNIFTQFKSSDLLKFRFEVGASFFDYKSDYSSYTEVIGEQDDRFEKRASLLTSFNFSKMLKLELPLRYSKSFYKNRSALYETGLFFTQVRGTSIDRDRIEFFKIDPKLSFTTSFFNFDLSIGWIKSKDLVSDGRTYSGFINNTSLTIPISEQSHFVKLAFEYLEVEFDTAKSGYDQSIDRKDTIYKIFIDYNVDKIFGSQFDLSTGYNYANHDENFYGGHFTNSTFQVTLKYNI